MTLPTDAVKIIRNVFIFVMLIFINILKLYDTQAHVEEG